MMEQFTDEEVATICARGEEHCLRAGETIFTEGDTADYIYYIDSGSVSVFIEQFNSREVIQSLGAGQLLGEMALFHSNSRTASASTLEDTRLTRIPTHVFQEIMSTHEAISTKIKETHACRSEELVLREKLIDLSGLSTSGCHIGIKGDPSLRESALSRERYESIVDRLMGGLLPVFEDLLLNRTAYRLFVGCNNGEVRISSVYDPFGEEYHPATRLIDKGYLERHFPKMDYAEKNARIRAYYKMMSDSFTLSNMPEHLRRGFDRYYATWNPLPKASIQNIISKFPLLREIPNFYIRSATITTIKDVIHLQFNCDGTHILSEKGYVRFLEENL